MPIRQTLDTVERYPGSLPRGAQPIHRQATLAGDETVALRIKYIGTASTAPTVQVTASAMVFVSSGDTDLPNDGNSAAGTLTFSDGDVNTIGELADVINTTGSWRAVLLDSIRSMLSVDLKVMSATSALGPGGVRIHWDHGDMSDGAAWTMAMAIAPGIRTNDWHGTEGSTFPKLPIDPDDSRWKDPAVLSRLHGVRAWFTDTIGTSLTNISIYRSTQDADTLIEKFNTAVDKTPLIGDGVPLDKDFSKYPYVGNPGERIVVTATGSAANTALLWEMMGYISPKADY